jgi:hypothetical protein
MSRYVEEVAALTTALLDAGDLDALICRASGSRVVMPGIREGGRP